MLDRLRTVLVPESIGDDPRLMRVGREAAWLHVAAIVYMQRHRNYEDFGELFGDDELRLMAWGREDANELVEKLVKAGLWKQGKIEGIDESRSRWYSIPDVEAIYEEIDRRDALRRIKVEAGRKGGIAKGQRQAALVG